MSTIPAKDNELYCFERDPFRSIHAVVGGLFGYPETPLFFSHDITEALQFEHPTFKLSSICRRPRVVSWLTPEGRRVTSAIDEDDVFRLIDDAPNPALAAAFELWFTGEMLPFFLEEWRKGQQAGMVAAPAPQQPPQKQQEIMIAGGEIIDVTPEDVTPVSVADNNAPALVEVPKTVSSSSSLSSSASSAAAAVPFQHPEFGEVRVVVDEESGEPWFVAKDVAVALEYNANSPLSTLLKHVPDIWKGVNRIYTPGGEQNGLCLSEQGLYFFLARSDKPKALPYQMWLAGEVLPAIRKHGGYLTPSKVEEALLNPDTLIKLATALKDERTARLMAEEARLQAEKAKAAVEAALLKTQTTLEQAKPGLALVNKVFGKTTRTVYEVARTLPGVNANAVKRALHESGYLRRSGGTGGRYMVSRKNGAKYFVEGYAYSGRREIFVTEDGAALLVRLHQNRQLPMRVGQ